MFLQGRADTRLGLRSRSCILTIGMRQRVRTVDMREDDGIVVLPSVVPERADPCGGREMDVLAVAETPVNNQELCTR